MLFWKNYINGMFKIIARCRLTHCNFVRMNKNTEILFKRKSDGRKIEKTKNDLLVSSEAAADWVSLYVPGGQFPLGCRWIPYLQYHLVLLQLAAFEEFNYILISGILLAVERYRWIFSFGRLIFSFPLLGDDLRMLIQAGIGPQLVVHFAINGVSLQNWIGW